MNSTAVLLSQPTWLYLVTRRDQNASFSLFLADIFEERTEINVTTPFPDSPLNSCVLRIALCPFPFLFLSFVF